MKDKTDDRKSNSERMKTKSDKRSDSKSDKESCEKDRNNISTVKPASDKNGMLCPKSVRNQMKKTQGNSDKKPDCKVENKDGSKSKIKDNSNSMYLVKKPITHISEDKTIEILKINREKVNLPVDIVKSTKCTPSLIYSCNSTVNEMRNTFEESEQTTKHKKKKKHGKSKVLNDSDDCNKETSKIKKSRKSKKKKHKELSPEGNISKKETDLENTEKEVPSNENKSIKVPMSLLVSYSSDEEDSHIVQPLEEVIKISPEIKAEEIKVEVEEKPENKIEIKIKPTKSPGKSAWDSTDSELENEPKEVTVKVKSRSISVISKHSKRTKSSSSKEKSESKSCSKSHSESPSRSGSQSHSRSHSRSSKSHSGSSDSRSRSYSRSHSRSYSESSDSRSRSYTRSRSRSRRKSRHHRRHSSSYSRSHSHYRSRSLSRSSRDSRSSRSYSRSRSRYKSSYSTRYRSRTRSRSSRSRSRTSYYRSSYRRRKRSSSQDDFLNPQNKKSKQILNRNSLLVGGAPKPIDISKKIDAIKESQKKVAEAHSNQNLSNLNIPLPPEKPKGNPGKPGPGEWCPSMDFGGPVAKKAKKIPGNKNNADGKGGDTIEGAMGSDNHVIEYIGPQVSNDMAKKLGLDVKASKKEKENANKKAAMEQSLNDSYFSQALDANHLGIISSKMNNVDNSSWLALQSRAYQHRLNNLQGSSSSDSFGQQTAQYFHPLYMSPSSLTNNLTATALAAVASEQLPASVAGSLAQAAVQRIMSSSNLTATYNTPAVVATPTAASYQTAFQHSIPTSCSTLVANTPSGLVPISLLQQGGLPYGINQLVLQHLQQQALGAQFGQAIAIPNQSLLGSINPLLFQASNQQALLQSLGFGAQTQLLASPLNFQHTLLMAAQQQQQQQMIAAAQLNQAATFQAAQLQAQIQAQARAASLQSLQQAAQMQSSAQHNAAAAAMAASVAMDHMVEQASKMDQADQMNAPISTSEEEMKLNALEYQMAAEQRSALIETNLISSSTTELNHFEESPVNTTVNAEPSSQETMFNTEGELELTVNNEVSSSGLVKQQAPRIIYNSPAVMASIVTSPVTKP